MLSRHDSQIDLLNRLDRGGERHLIVKCEQMPVNLEPERLVLTPQRLLLLEQNR